MDPSSVDPAWNAHGIGLYLIFDCSKSAVRGGIVYFFEFWELEIGCDTINIGQYHIVGTSNLRYVKVQNNS